MNENLIVRQLADAYISDTSSSMLNALLRIGTDREHTGPVGGLALRLFAACTDDGTLDDLLDEIRHLEHDDTHSVCCQGDCYCATGSTSFVHPVCEHCDQVRVERQSDLIETVLALLPAEVRKAS